MSWSEYLEDLGDAFDHYIKAAELSTQDLLHLESIARGESVRDSGDRMNTSHVASVKGRQRAITHLVKAMGAVDRFDYPAMRKAILNFMEPGTVGYLPEFTTKARPAHV
jgi:hypothetical protein